MLCRILSNLKNPFSSIKFQDDTDIKPDASSGSSQGSASAADEQQTIQPEQVKEVLLKEAEKEGIEVADSKTSKKKKSKFFIEYLQSI